MINKHQEVSTQSQSHTRGRRKWSCWSWWRSSGGRSWWRMKGAVAGAEGGVNKCFMSQFFLVNCAEITTDCHAEEPRKFLWSRPGKKVNGAVVRFTESLTLIVNLQSNNCHNQTQLQHLRDQPGTPPWTTNSSKQKEWEWVACCDWVWEICIISTYWGGRG